jgi:hypothetical protein
MQVKAEHPRKRGEVPIGGQDRESAAHGHRAEQEIGV